MGKATWCLRFLVSLGIGYWFNTLFPPMERILVEISDGKLLGNVMINRKGGEFYAFQAIPYAEPPVGNLRFKAPRPPSPWKNVRDASQPIPVCRHIQLGKHLGGEDCLYLNVYTKSIKADSRLPVMVYIHGGSFYEGSASINIYGPQNLLTEDIVLVTINYRLGALGFVSLEGSEDISANNGLKDQVEALRWVQKHIRSFGGNPESVTIFGESAGGASVHLHLLSPMSKGLFHRAIAQSGTALNAWSLGAKNTAIPLAKHLGIDTSDPKQIGSRLRQFSVEEIFAAQQNSNWAIRLDEAWNGAPVPEGAGPNSFLPDLAEKIVQSGDYNKVPLMVGYTNRESLIMLVFQKLLKTKFIRDFNTCVPSDLSLGDKAKAMSAIQRLKKFYFDQDEDGDEFGDGDLAMVTDSWFKYPVIRTARAHAKSHPVFLYEFSADTKMNFFKRMHEFTAKIPGASHVDDLGYLFKSDLSEEIVPGSIEEEVVERFVLMWTSFAKTGNPTPLGQADQSAIWRPVETDKLNFLNISNVVTAGTLSGNEIKLWDELYSQRSRLV